MNNYDSATNHTTADRTADVDEAKASDARRALLRGVWDLARFTPVGALASVALAACGGSDSPADGGNSPGAPSPSTTRVSPTTTTTTSSLFPTTTAPATTTTTFPGVTTTTSATTSTTSSTAVTSSSTTSVSSSTSTSSTSISSTSSSTTSTTVPGPAPGPAQRTFTFLGPNQATLSSNSGMMGGAGAPTVALADGRVVRVWTLNGGAGGFNSDRVFPGPVIELIEAQQAAITLNSATPHTIHPHGLDVNTANDGVPQTSGFVSMMPPQAPGQVGGSLGSPFTYRFVAPFAGTYFYHCHVDAALHMEMGMYGAVIVRPRDGATNVAWTGGPAFTKEYIWQLHTFAASWHTAGNTGLATLRYVPDAFLINGRDGPALLNDATTAISAPQGSKVLLRLISYGQMPAIVDLGGVPFEVIASDGRPLKQAPIAGRATWRITPGERYDLLLTMPAAGVRQATVTYQNIRGSAAVGAAQTTITSV